MSDEIPGINFGDLPEKLDAIARHAEPETALPLEPEYDGFCAHRKARINAGMRRLTCRECDAALDPFDFLVKLSTDAQQWVSTRREIEQRARAAKIRLEDLLRQERNARNRLKRLGVKKPPPGDETHRA